MAARAQFSPGPAAWADDLTPLPHSEWSYDRAAHLLAHAGFGGAPEDIQQLADLGPERAVETLVRYEAIPNSRLRPFVESGFWEPSLNGFPDSRPEATDRAEQSGASMGVATKPAGYRPLQPVSDRFFYWLRATMLETRRLGYWWANRMLQTAHPLEQKMALLWHGHFATHENKVRDYRKMHQQIELFERRATGNLRDLTIAVAQNPAMLYFLDAQYNVKGAPNENFAREVMELFTMGVGNYTEKDVRECARAFTGWYFDDLAFKVDPEKHDDGPKDFLGRTGNFDGVDVLKIVFEQPVTAEYFAAKIYRFLVRGELSPALRAKLAAVLRDADYEAKPLLTAILRSKDFYSAASVGTQIKGPVQLVISTYRKLGLAEVPGVPDFNSATSALGQLLFRPPTVAGWAQGRSWVTPGLLLERGNFARDLLFPDFMATANDRYPGLIAGEQVRAVHERISRGMDITSATVPEGKAEDGAMAMSNRMADRDEDFNTRYASYRGWQQAVEAVKPIPRTMARPDVAGIVVKCGSKTTTDAVDCLARRFFSVPIAPKERAEWIAFLTRELGTDQIEYDDLARLPAMTLVMKEAQRLVAQNGGMITVESKAHFFGAGYPSCRNVRNVLRPSAGRWGRSPWRRIA